MGETTHPNRQYRSVDEFRQRFYPKSFKFEAARRESEDSFGRDLARYVVEKHFPSHHSDEPTK
jgi:hypothetical protein